jgi:hypothetical protein
MVIYAMQETIFDTRPQGAFSDFMSVIGAILYAQFHGAAAVKVYYNNPLYVEPERGDNYFDYFYESSLILLKPYIDLSARPAVHFNSYFGRLGVLGAFSRFAIGYHRNEDNPFPVRAYRPLLDLHYAVKDRVKPRKFLLDMADEFVEKELWGGPRAALRTSDAFVLGVHFRGTDKKIAYPYSAPSYAVFDYAIQQTLRAYAIDRQRSWVIFCATDETEFAEWMTQRYGARVAMLQSSPRLTKHDTTPLKYAGVHKSSKYSNYDKGLYGMLDMLLLSRTHFLIKNRSSVSDVALIFNPFRNYTFVLSKNDPVLCTDETLPTVPKEVWDLPPQTTLWSPA